MNSVYAIVRTWKQIFFICFFVFAFGLGEWDSTAGLRARQYLICVRPTGAVCNACFLQIKKAKQKKNRTESELDSPGGEEKTQHLFAHCVPAKAFHLRLRARHPYTQQSIGCVCVFVVWLCVLTRCHRIRLMRIIRPNKQTIITN